MEQKPQMPLSRLAIMSLLLFAIIGISQLLPGAVVPVDYSTFISQVNEGQLKEVKAYPNGSYMALTGLSAQDDKETKTKSYWQSQIDWLLERFPDGEYRDVIGLCKAAPLKGEDGIEDQDYSLNAGRYVGVVIEDDGMTEEEFKEEMLLLSKELEKINSEARSLEERVLLNLQELFNK